MDELILGLDEAGKGPVIGPMILAGCLIDRKIEKEFRLLGVKDSKMVTPNRREILDKEIKSKAINFKTVAIFPDDIDDKSEKGIKMTELEAEIFSSIINELNDDKTKIKVVIDCPSFGISKWTDMLKTKIKNLSNLEFVIEHKADKNHIAVAAASLLAKAEREREVSKLKEIYGDEIGSGYCSDPLTIKFLEKFALKHKNKGIFRKSWITWKNAATKLKQVELNF